MKRPRSDRDIAEEIAKKLSEDTPENAAMEVQSLLQRAQDAGGGALRAEYLVKAQRAITRLDPAWDPALIHKFQAQMLALQGRRGDTKVAHVTSGEIVIPKRLHTTELIQALSAAARANGIDPAALRIGSGRNSINPNTGQPEFADGVLAPPQGPMETIEVTERRPFSPNDINNAARIVYAAGANQPLEAKQRVMQTMLSRVGTDSFPTTLNEVMFQKGYGPRSKRPTIQSTYRKYESD